MLGPWGVSSMGSSSTGDSNGDGISILNRIGIATRIANWYTIFFDWFLAFYRNDMIIKTEFEIDF